MSQNLAAYGPFAAMERLLMALGKAGADRQVMHERLREQAMQAWAIIQSGQPNPLIENLAHDSEILRYLSPEDVHNLMDARHHLGDAPLRARKLAEHIRQALDSEINGPPSGARG
jgi:adenylosuccinate lyase